MTNPDMPDSRCRLLYGFPLSFADLTHRITTVYFPDVKETRSSMVRNTPLTKFEQALSCLHLFKSGALVSEIAMHWGVPFWQMGRYIKVWSKRWEEVAKDHVLLDPCPETFKWLQPLGYTVSYNTHINTYTHTICTPHAHSHVGPLPCSHGMPSGWLLCRHRNVEEVFLKGASFILGQDRQAGRSRSNMECLHRSGVACNSSVLWTRG